MSKRKKLLTKNVLCAVMAASVVAFSNTTFAQDYPDGYHLTSGEETINDGVFSTQSENISSIQVENDGTKLILNKQK